MWGRQEKKEYKKKKEEDSKIEKRTRPSKKDRPTKASLAKGSGNKQPAILGVERKGSKGHDREGNTKERNQSGKPAAETGRPDRQEKKKETHPLLPARAKEKGKGLQQKRKGQ